MEQEVLYETGFRKWIIAITVIMCTIIELIDTSIVNVALPQVMGNLGATLSEASWVIAAYGIANVIVVPMSGWFSRQFGRRNYYMGSVILFTIASILCGNADNIWELVFFRFIQGIGGGALFATSQTILNETFPKKEAPLANGIFGMGIVIGPTIGPTIGGLIVDNASWQWIFYVNIPIGIVATLLTFLFIKDKVRLPRIPSSQVDWLGIALLITGIGSLQLVLEQGEREDWFESVYIMTFVIIAALGIIGFIWRELTAKNPIVDLRVLKHRTLSIGVLFSFMIGFGLFASVFAIPVFAQRLLSFTATQTGLMLLPGALMTGFMMPVIGKIVQKGAPPILMIPIGFGLFALFTFLLSGVTTPGTGENDFFWLLLIRGVGLGFAMIPILTLSLSDLKGPELAQGAGLTSMMRQLGGSFGVAIISTYIERRSYINRSNLLSHLSIYDPAVQDRLNKITQGLMSKGSPDFTAKQQANGILESILYRQTMLLSFMDTFLLLCGLFICCIPFALLIKRKRKPVISIPSDLAH